MSPIIERLLGQLNNQFVGGGLVLMFTGSVIALLRSAPVRFMRWTKSRFTRQIAIENTDPLFDYVTYWLNSQQRFRRSRYLKATTSLSLRQASDRNGCPEVACDSSGAQPKRRPLEVFFSPSTGRHLFRYCGSWLSITRGGPEKTPAGNSAGGATQGQESTFRMKQESYFIESYGRNDGEVMKELIREIIDFGTQEAEGVRLYRSTWGHWSSDGYMRMRRLSTVVLPAGVAELVLEDMREFRAQEAWYRDLGIPWHKGYLFSGFPGTGKTSLAAALSGELDMDVYLLSLSGSGMNDESLNNLMANVRPGCMVILEDVDCTIPTREMQPGANRITLSGLLNCLDGITSKEGCVIVMTTNRREVLDSALIRPGRIDFELEFGLADMDQITRLAGRIGVDADGLRGGEMTMAEVQKELVARYKGLAVAAEAYVA